MRSLLVGLIVMFLVFSPFIVIWSLNTLFPVLAIPYDIQTWFAMLFFLMFFASTKSKASSKE